MLRNATVSVMWVFVRLNGISICVPMEKFFRKRVTEDIRYYINFSCLAARRIARGIAREYFNGLLFLLLYYPFAVCWYISPGVSLHSPRDRPRKLLW